MAAAEDTLWEVRKLARTFLEKYETHTQSDNMDSGISDQSNILGSSSSNENQLKRRRLGEIDSSNMVDKSYLETECAKWREKENKFQRELDSSVREIRFLEDRLQSQEKRYNEKVESFEKERGSLYDKLKSALQKPVDSTVFNEKVRQAANRKVEQLLIENKCLKEDLQSSIASSESTIESLNLLHKQQLDSMQAHNEDLQRQISSIMSSEGMSRNETRVKLADERLKGESESRVKPFDDGRSVILQSELDHTLEELKQARSQLSELDNMRSQVSAWESLFSHDILPRDSNETVTAHKVFEALSQSRTEEIKLQKLLGNNEVIRRELECKVDEQAQQLSEVVPAYHQNMQTLHRMKKDLSAYKMLAEKGKEALERRDALLKSYEVNEKKAGQRGEEQVVEKLQLLTDELRAKDETLKALELQLKERGATGSEERCQELSRQVSQLDQANTLLKRQLERVESELSSAGGKGYKVIQMIKNPSSDAALERRQKEKARVEQLEIENAELRQRVGSGGGASESGGQAQAPPPNLVNERLKELFKKNVQQFKHAVRQLFGYELIFSPGKASYHLKVRSVFAEQEEDYFIFEWKDDDQGNVDMSKPLQLLTTDFALKMKREKPKMYAVYLDTYNCIPLFLGEVTNELFHNTTQFHQLKGF